MFNNKTIKFIAIILLAGQLAVFPSSVLAQFTINPVPTNDGGSAAQNLAFSIAMKIPQTAYSACLKTVETLDVINGSAQLNFTGLSLIGGGSVELTTLAAKVALYENFISCVSKNPLGLPKKVLDMVEDVPAPNAYTSAQKQAFISQVTAAIQAYKLKLENAQARYNNAKQGFWKTLVFNILIKTSKSVATSLVQKLVSNYKVRNVMQYTDSVATLMYDNQFIRQNFPNAQEQFMARAILENPLVRYEVPSYAFIAADAALGFDPKMLDTNDPDFYVKMSHVGSTMANPYYQHTTNIGGVDQARAQSLQYAQAQVTASNGLKTPVSCGGSMAQQQSIDAQYKAASDRLNDRTALLRNLTQAKRLGQNVSDSDLQKAQIDYEAAKNALDVLPKNVSSPALAICEAIVSPASLIDRGIDEAFKALGSKIGQYDNNNLPTFMNLIGDVASQIGSSLIFGGLDGAKGAMLINEQRVVNAAVQAGTEALYSNASENLAKGIEFSAYASSNGNWYDLYWDIIPSMPLAEKANFVTISGDGISDTKIDPKTKVSTPNKQPISGNARIYPTKSGPYILTVFDVTGRALTSVSMNLNVSSTQAYNSGTGPQVAGAYTSREQINIRGEASVIEPRGH